MLTGKGITAWRRAVAHLTPAPGPASTRTSSGAAAAPRPPVMLPEPVTTELIHALAGLAVALTGPSPPLPPLDPARSRAGKEHPCSPAPHPRR